MVKHNQLLKKGLTELFEHYSIVVEPGDGNYNGCLETSIDNKEIRIYPKKGHKIETILPENATGLELRMVSFMGLNHGVSVKSENYKYIIFTEPKLN